MFLYMSAPANQTNRRRPRRQTQKRAPAAARPQSHDHPRLPRPALAPQPPFAGCTPESALPSARQKPPGTLSAAAARRSSPHGLAGSTLGGNRPAPTREIAAGWCYRARSLYHETAACCCVAVDAVDARSLLLSPTSSPCSGRLGKSVRPDCRVRHDRRVGPRR